MSLFLHASFQLEGDIVLMKGPAGQLDVAECAVLQRLCALLSGFTLERLPFSSEIQQDHCRSSLATLKGLCAAFGATCVNAPPRCKQLRASCRIGGNVLVRAC